MRDGKKPKKTNGKWKLNFGRKSKKKEPTPEPETETEEESEGPLMFGLLGVSNE